MHQPATMQAHHFALTLAIQTESVTLWVFPQNTRAYPRPHSESQTVLQTGFVTLLDTTMTAAANVDSTRRGGVIPLGHFLRCSFCP